MIGHERGFTFRVYNPAGVDMAALRECQKKITARLLEQVRKGR